ncbi:hypothetical protein DPMN_143888 [Dreissena polymorpha]|uniref:Uncharacterized protein n=1 Tax=Dreissena polymorpha TaxID=45954 RepID=A0A9D4GH26_DREPO|nr:hypothetical protein DPMN_143888 [Dreissena polymorpha]
MLAFINVKIHAEAVLLTRWKTQTSGKVAVNFAQPRRLLSAMTSYAFGNPSLPDPPDNGDKKRKRKPPNG